MSSPVLNAVPAEKRPLLTAWCANPVDFTTREFAHVYEAVAGVVEVARELSELQTGNEVTDPATLELVHYGSPVEILILVPPAIAGTLLTLAKAVDIFMSAVQRSASIQRERGSRSANVKEARRASARSSEALKDNERELRRLLREQLAQMLPEARVLRDDVDASVADLEIGSLNYEAWRMSHWLFDSARTLATFNISLVVTDVGDDDSASPHAG